MKRFYSQKRIIEELSEINRTIITFKKEHLLGLIVSGNVLAEKPPCNGNVLKFLRKVIAFLIWNRYDQYS